MNSIFYIVLINSLILINGKCVNQYLTSYNGFIYNPDYFEYNNLCKWIIKLNNINSINIEVYNDTLSIFYNDIININRCDDDNCNTSSNLIKCNYYTSKSHCSYTSTISDSETTSIYMIEYIAINSTDQEQDTQYFTKFMFKYSSTPIDYNMCNYNLCSDYCTTIKFSNCGTPSDCYINKTKCHCTWWYDGERTNSGSLLSTKAGTEYYNKPDYKTNGRCVDLQNELKKYELSSGIKNNSNIKLFFIIYVFYNIINYIVFYQVITIY